MFPFRAGAVVLGLVILAVPANVLAGGPVPFSLVRINAPSPFAGCSKGMEKARSRLFPNAVVEPSVAVDPRSGGTRLIAAWQQDRWSDGGSRGLAAAYSSDGGRTWHESTLPVSSCAPGGPALYGRATDPWVSFGPDGTAYLAAMPTYRDASAMMAATSRDGGRTWQNWTYIKTDNNASDAFDDKEAITADPTRPGTAYYVWDRLFNKEPNGPTWFSATRNGGLTWSPARPIFDPHVGQTIGNQIVVGPRGTLYDFFDWILYGKQQVESIAFIRSRDAGRTWSVPHLVASQLITPVRSPLTGGSIRAGEGIPTVAVDRRTGRIYVAWIDSRYSSDAADSILESESDNGGTTWSLPAPVSFTSRHDAFVPTIAVNASGQLGVSFYMLLPPNRRRHTQPVDYWFRRFSPRGQPLETRKIAGPFNIFKAANSGPEEGNGGKESVIGGYFLGDYQGMAAAGNTFYLAFVKTDRGTPAGTSNLYLAVAG